MKLKSVLKSIAAAALALSMCVVPVRFNSEEAYAMEAHGGVMQEKGDWSIYYCHKEGCDSYHIFQYLGNKTTVEVPEEINGYRVTYIEGGAFPSNVKKLIIPDSIEHIAYYRSLGLPNVTIVSSENSYAHKFAEEEGLKWKNLDEIVGDLKNLKQDKVYNLTSIKLSWDKVSGAKGYEIYRASKKKGKYVKIATTKNTSYKCRKLKSGTDYYFKVRAFKDPKTGREYGEYSSKIKMSTKTDAPVIKLKASGNKVKISWKKVKGVGGYEVYMSTNKKNGYEKIKKNSSSKLSYVQNNLDKNKKYYFKVKSYKNINGKKVYSKWSDVKSVLVK